MGDSDMLNNMGAATRTYRQEVKDNEDAFAVLKNVRANFVALIVADGLGSYAYAKEASEKVVNFVEQQLNSITNVDAIDCVSLFQKAKIDLQKYAQEHYPDHPDEAFGTTLIVVIELPEEIIIAYVGNGAVWHLRGDFNRFNSQRSIPWNSLNYLNPHSIQNDQGKEALYRLISDNKTNNHEAIPTVLKISKDNHYAGDIIVACTDGLYSSDQVPVGKLGAKETLWLGENDRMALFYKHLNKYFSNLDKQPSLDVMLMDLLKATADQEPLDDDTTIAILITRQVFTFQKKFHSQATEKK